RASSFNTGRLDPIYADPHSGQKQLFLYYGDLSDASALARLIGKIQPEEIYNLAAQSHVRVSFDSPEYTADISATGTVRLLEAIRETGLKPRFYQASSSEMFGLVGLDWQKHVEIDPRYYRPAEVDLLIGDYSKAKRQLGWEPKTRFVDLVKLMVDADVELLRRHRHGEIKVSG